MFRILMKSNLSMCLSFYGYCLDSVSKNFLPSSKSQRSFMFSFKSFMVLYFAFRSLFKYELIWNVWSIGQIQLGFFLCVCGGGVQMDAQLFWHHLLKGCHFFSIVLAFHFGQKSLGYLCVGFISGLSISGIDFYP